MSYQSKRDGLSNFKARGGDKGKTMNLQTPQFCDECRTETRTKVFLDHYGFGSHLKVCIICEIPR